MRIFNQFSLLTVASVTLGWLTMAQANAASFTFTKIADTQSDFTSLESGIALNDSGVVSFVGTTTTSGVFTGNGTAIATIVDAANLPSLFPPGSLTYIPDSYPPNTYSFGNSTAINNQGTVLFTATDSGSFTQATISSAEQALFQSRNGSISQVGTLKSNLSSGQGSSQIYTSFDINDSDQLLTSVLQSYYFFRPGNQTTIVLDGKTIAQASSVAYGPQAKVYAPVINNQGTVFYALSASPSTSFTPLMSNILYVFNNGVVKNAVVDRQVSLKTLAANDSSAVFSGTVSSVIYGNEPDESGIFQVENGVAKRIFDGTADSIDINNQGVVAFDADNKISILSNGVSEQIIGSGDSLLGSTVKSVFFPSSKSLNNAGQLAFYVELADGTKGIFRADPISTKVPEPGAILGLVAIAGLGISSRRRFCRS